MAGTHQHGTDDADRRDTSGRGAVPGWAISLLCAAALIAGIGFLIDRLSGRDELTVYSSLPRQGSQRTRTLDTIAGIELALEQAHGKAGKFDVKHVSLDDSSTRTGRWAPGEVTQNAQRVAADDDAAVYIGDFNSGASAYSIPILSEARVPQISPSNTAVGLTTDEPGADEGEPYKYYVDGYRNFVRIVPRDTIQAQALVMAMRHDGCSRAFVVHDRELYGAGLARNIRRAARRRGLPVSLEAVESKSGSYQRALAQRIAAAGADCVVFSGDTQSGAVGIMTATAHALPAARLYGSDGVADRAFTDYNRGGLSERVADRVMLTLPTVGSEGFTGSRARRFFADFARKHPANRNPDPYAIYGFEAMALALDAIERSKSGDRDDIMRALLHTTRRRSVLGTYSIDRNGDTTLKLYGLFEIRDGAPRFVRTIP